MTGRHARWAVATMLITSATALTAGALAPPGDAVPTAPTTQSSASSQAPQSSQAALPAVGSPVFAYVRALDEAAARGVWPEFTTSAVPLAVFDGERTFLFRHPSPPPEFSPVPGHPGVFLASGRYAGVQGNSNRDIGGVRTATVIVTPAQSAERAMLAIVEEVFHVFWRTTHSVFRPDELTRYAYPLRDADNLRRLLAEDEALSRALEATEAVDAARWAEAALRIRRERTAGLAEDVRAFETAIEMLEGPANYVARVAVGEPPGRTADRLRAPRPAEDIRWRFYDSGAALCLLLDRLSPGWRERIQRQPTLAIGPLAEEAVRAKGVEAATFPAAETTRLAARADAGVAELVGHQQRLRTELFNRPGWRMTVEVEEGVEPFQVRRFDPINLMVLDAGEIVHPNYLSLTVPGGSVEFTNTGFVRDTFGGTVAITSPAGAHPLRQGVRRLTIVGLSGEPTVASRSGATTLEAPGVRLTLAGADTRVEGTEIRIIVKRHRP